MVTALGPLNSGLGGLHRDVLELQSQLDGLQRQLSTGKKAETYGGLGTDRLLVLSLRERITTLESYSSTVDQVQIRLTDMQHHLDRFRSVAAEIRTSTFLPDFTSLNNGQTTTQVSAGVSLNEVLALMNADIAGRHLFSGRATDTDAAVSDSVLLNGEGSAAGFEQVVAERKLADAGADGRGRLAVTSVSPTVSLAEDAAGHPFGLKLAGVTSGLTGTTVSGPAGSPAAIDVTFSATLPQPGQSIRVTFDLPDGTQEVFELTATASNPPGDGEFLLGVDETDTATNFEAALNAQLVTFGSTVLASASTKAAANDFFFYDAANPPQRVAGPPFETATTLVDGTTADTVFWYRGDNDTGSARETAIAHVDDNQNIAYGVRANEEPLATLVAGLAVLAVETFDETVAGDKDRYEALAQRVASDFNYQNKTSIDDLIVELGFKQKALDDADARHTAARQVSLDLLQTKEGADDYEVSAKILRLQTQISTSFEITSLLTNLSLVNFLR